MQKSVHMRLLKTDGIVEGENDTLVFFEFISQNCLVLCIYTYVNIQ